MSRPFEYIGQRLAEIRKRIGISAVDAAKIAEVSDATWRRYERGETEVSVSAVAKFCDEFGVSFDWLVTGRGPLWLSERLGKHIPSKDVALADFIAVPLHDVQGSCGDGSVIHSEQIVDYLAFKREWISRVATDPKRLALIEAAGDSMMPTIHSGDLLLIDLCITRIEQDAIYAINVDGMLYVKRIQKRLDGTVIVKSDNPAYEEQRFNASEAEALRIVGRVIWMGKRV